MSDNSIIVVAGPTASGKTKLGIELARRYDGEIVSADSMQIYRGMDIGTAKATPEERAQAVHHMLDVTDPGEAYSVARYVDEAGKICDDILSRGKTPILVGGTGLYIDSLVAGRDFADNQEDRTLRAELETEYDRVGGEAFREPVQGGPLVRREVAEGCDVAQGDEEGVSGTDGKSVAEGDAGAVARDDAVRGQRTEGAGGFFVFGC